MAWLGSYLYRKAINIGSSAGAGTNYQVKVIVQPGAGTDGTPSGTIYLNSKSAFFPNDLAFTDNDGSTLLDYWYEYDSNNFWVEVADTLESNATIYLYYGNVSALPNPISAPTPAVWKKYVSNPVLTVGAGGAWDNYWVQFNSIWQEGSTYYGYYQGCQNDDLFRIGLATSTDGITWTKDGGNPVLTVGDAGAWDDSLVGYPCVWKEGSTWYMMYSGKKAATGISSIGLATSPDGIVWTKSGSNPVYTSGAAWDDSLMQPGTRMIKEGSTYYLYYWGNTTYALNTAAGIGLATSTDLTTWTKSANNPLLGTTGNNTWDACVLAPTVILFGSTYYMWYEGATSDGALSVVGLASSAAKDSGWSRVGTVPVLDRSQGLAGASALAGDVWDTGWAEIPVLVLFGGEWRMYYGGSKGITQTPRCQGGYASYTVTGSGANTFLLFDDFNGRTLNAGLWNNLSTFVQDANGVEKYNANGNAWFTVKSQNTYAAPLSVEAKAKAGANWSNEYSWAVTIGYDSAINTSGYYAGHYKDASSDYSAITKAPGAVRSQTNEAWAWNNTYAKLSLQVGATTQQLLMNGTQKGQVTTSVPTNPTNVLILTARPPSTGDYTTYFDWIFVRKYLNTEPAISSFGGEEEVGSSEFVWFRNPPANNVLLRL